MTALNPVIEASAPGADASQSFEDRLVTAFNEAAMALMLSIGHRTGLFDALKGQPPLRSEAIAETTGLTPRYVHEWLGCMVTAGIIDLDPETSAYQLPDAHAELLTRDGEANLAVFAQYFGLLGSVEDDIVDCFKSGGGVPYERFGRFHEIMAEESGQTVLPVLIDLILPLAPETIERLDKGIRVLDLGCGRGRAMMMLAERFPNSRFTGYDLSPQAVDWAEAERRKRGLDNVRFERRDLSDFDQTAETDAFDLVTTFDAIHDQAKPKNLLRGIHRTLAPSGVYLAQDIKGSSHHHHDREHPLGPLLYTVSCMHCMTVSLAQGGEGLGAMWGREVAERYFAEAGFTSIAVHELDHDPQNYYYVCRA